MFDNVQNYHLSTPQELYTGIKTKRRCKVGAMSVRTAIFQTSPSIAYMSGEMYPLLDVTATCYNTLHMLHIDLEIMSESQTGRKRSAGGI